MAELLAGMPKVELHLHLEGAIPLDALWSLVTRHGGEAEVPDRAALARRFAYRDFPHFIDTWIWKLRFHQTLADYRFLAEAVAADLARQRIVYAEAYISPTDAAGLEVGPLLRAVRAGLDRVPETTVALIPDLVRDTGPQRAAATLAEVVAVKDETGVVGVTIGGSEQSFPPEPFAPVYQEARQAGLRLTAHAGEAAGPESVWGAIRWLEVDRIGHGIRAVEDSELVAHLARTLVPLEICPTSNLRTGVVPNWENHPVRTLIDAGVMVTINTDDPVMFGCSLAGEYAALAEQFGYGWDTLLELAANSIEASWAEETRKLQLRRDLADWRVDARV